MDSLQGQFLIASPHLPDPNFSQSVVLMIEHHEAGALGLIINRPMNTLLCELWKQVAGTPCESTDAICYGGPVEGPVIALHADPAHSESEVVPDVHVATQKDNLRSVVMNNKRPLRVFTGYAGWGAGQLESELTIGGWLTHPAKAELVFCEDLTALWRHILNLTGKQILHDALGISGFPEDPRSN